MEPTLTVKELLSVLDQVAPLIQGTWGILSVVTAAIIAGAVWITRISIAVRNNTIKIAEGNDNTSNSMCSIHRDACDKKHAIEYSMISAVLIEIKESINKINDRHERYQEALLRTTTKE